MVKNCTIKPPFFEVGPKAFMYGKRMLELAKKLDELCERYDVDIILTPQYVDIYPIARAVKRLSVFAQHMDPLPVGRGLGSILPEAVKEAGATGVMLNHAECKISLPAMNATIKRADSLGLYTIVCSDSLEEAAAIARLSPNIIVAEPTELIGTGQTSDMDYVQNSIRTIKGINPDILVLQGAGISTGEDVYRVIRAGAEGTGCTSGIMKSSDPEAMSEEMISAMRRAFDDARA